MSAHLVAVRSLSVVESEMDANTSKKCPFLTFSLKTLLNHRNLIFKAIKFFAYIQLNTSLSKTTTKTIDYYEQRVTKWV